MTMSEYLHSVSKEIRNRNERSEIIAEIQQHMEELMEEYIAEGLSPLDAETAAIEEMGDAQEVGSMLDKVHPPAFEWPQIAGLAGSLFGIYVTKNTMLDTLMPIENFQIFYITIGYFLILYSVGIIVMEKYFDLRFHYGRSQTGGSNANSVLIAGIGISFVSHTAWQCAAFGIIYGLLMMILRQYIENLRAQKEKKYIWAEGTAVTVIANTGKAIINNETHKVCTRRKDTIEKGQSLTVVGIDGFRLYVVGK